MKNGSVAHLKKTTKVTAKLVNYAVITISSRHFFPVRRANMHPNVRLLVSKRIGEGIRFITIVGYLVKRDGACMTTCKPISYLRWQTFVCSHLSSIFIASVRHFAFIFIYL